MDFPHFKSGKYWIDPNGGSKADAVLAYCDFKTNFSCIYPVNTKLKPTVDLSVNQKHYFLDDEIEYNSNSIQMNFLRVFSRRGYQNVTYHCRNSHAWRSRDSIKLVGSNEVEYHKRSPTSIRPTVALNDCNMKDGKWHKTVLEMTSKHGIPIVDVGVYDIKSKDQEFELEFGPACFA